MRTRLNVNLNISSAIMFPGWVVSYASAFTALAGQTAGLDVSCALLLHYCLALMLTKHRGVSCSVRKFWFLVLFGSGYKECAWGCEYSHRVLV